MMEIPLPEQAEAIIFDLDGTLVDSMPMHYEAYQYALEPWSITYPQDVFQSRAGIPTADTLHMIAQDYNIENFDVHLALGRKREYIHDNLHKLALIGPVAQIMMNNFGKLPLSIGTGSHRKMVARVVALFELDKYIKHIVTADDVENHKPHPDTFLRCAELMEINPENCVVYEDGDLGIEAALQAKMQVVDVRKYLITSQA